MADFTLIDHGSIVVLNANTDAARSWADDHLPADRTTWGPHGTVIEPRYVGDIVDGIQGDGLEIEI